MIVVLLVALKQASALVGRSLNFVSTLRHDIRDALVTDRFHAPLTVMLSAEVVFPTTFIHPAVHM